MKLTTNEYRAAALQARRFLHPDDYARIPLCQDCGGKGVKSKVEKDRYENLEIISRKCRECAGTGKQANDAPPIPTVLSE